MKLERKIARTFALFGILAGIFLGVVYAILAYSGTRARVLNAARQAALVSQKQVENLMSQAKTAGTVLLSDMDVLNAIHTLANEKDVDREGSAELYFSDSYSEIREKVSTYFTIETFYRVVYFNDRGDVVAGNNIQEHVVDPDADWESVPGLDQISPGELRLVGMHTDEWGKSHEATVVSAIKQLVGSNMGYIEVQWLKSELDSLLQPEDASYSVYLFDQNGELLYGPDDGEEITAPAMADMTGEKLDAKTGRLTLADWNEEAGVCVLLSYRADVVRDIVIRILPWMLLVLALFYVLSRIYSKYAAARLVRPIEALSHVMRQTDLENMTRATKSVEEELRSTKETEELYLSYQDVMERLYTSMEQEKRFSMLQLQAQMDLLQAQVNPHFLYNVLNVISAKGIMANDESICDICAKLGKMLRYSTNTKEKSGTIREEKEYLELYFAMLKYRYEHKLEYEITIDPAIEEVRIPKIVLQQFVENSINHGYADKSGLMRIAVIGQGSPDAWTLIVRDHGSGFTDEKKKEIEDQIGQMRQRLSVKREHVEMEIGGFGMINTWARLYLVFGERLHFRIESGPESTDVAVSVADPDDRICAIADKESEFTNVQSAGEVNRVRRKQDEI